MSGFAFPFTGLPPFAEMHAHIRVCPVPGNDFSYARVHYLERHSHIVGYHNIWECISNYCGTPGYGNASPDIGLPQYMRMHAHVLRSPTREFVPRYWGTPVYGSAFPDIGDPSNRRCIPTYTILGHPQSWNVLGCPIIWECICSCVGAPRHMGMHSHTLGYPNVWEYAPRY
jgi:hypothetical protein